jgi:hypothetical protein
MLLELASRPSEFNTSHGKVICFWCAFSFFRQYLGERFAVRRGYRLCAGFVEGTGVHRQMGRGRTRRTGQNFEATRTTENYRGSMNPSVTFTHVNEALVDLSEAETTPP